MKANCGAGKLSATEKKKNAGGATRRGRARPATLPVRPFRHEVEVVFACARPSIIRQSAAATNRRRRKSCQLRQRRTPPTTEDEYFGRPIPPGKDPAELFAGWPCEVGPPLIANRPKAGNRVPPLRRMNLGIAFQLWTMFWTTAASRAKLFCFFGQERRRRFSSGGPRVHACGGAGVRRGNDVRARVLDQCRWKRGDGLFRRECPRFP